MDDRELASWFIKIDERTKRNEEMLMIILKEIGEKEVPQETKGLEKKDGRKHKITKKEE